MSTTIHQIYCTHCTFGTSALERREGEIAGRVLGYSARAGSLDRDELRKAFRLVERYLYYSLPSDTPSDEKLRLDAASAPRRLIFLPSVGGLQVVGQVSYRQKDTSRDQRVGSYFGHLLVSEPKSEPWSVLDCLQLWGAPWVAEDSPTIPFQLKTLAGLNLLRTSPRPAIDDAVLVSFLTAPPGQPFDDPQQVIPPRWRNVSRTERVSLLADILRAYLELGAGRRESVLVVVEPSLAAVLFYGVARLIPAGKLRDEVSFSTFEPNPERLQTSLAATTFHDPKNSDLKPDAYRRPGWVINTFLNRNSTNAPRSKGVFAKLVLDKLAAHGLNSVDELLLSFQAVSIERPADLELLAEASALLPILLDPGTAASDSAWRNSPTTAAFLNVALRRQLAGLSPNSARLKELASGLNGLTLLELLAASAEGREDPLVPPLLQHLPAETFSDLLGSKRIPIDYKADAIAAAIARTGRFPENCPQLWEERAASTKESDGVANRLLPAVLSRIDPKVLQQLKPPATPELTRAFMIGLVQAGKLNPAIQSLADRRVTGLDDEQLIDFLTDHGAELRPFYPDGETRLSRRLRNILFDTPLFPTEFIKRLDLLRAWDRFLNNDYEMELWLLPLEKIRREFVALSNAIAEQNAVAKSRWSKQPSINYHEFGRRLLEAVELAMPAKRYGADDRGARKVECLREAGRAVLGQKDFGSLDQTFWAAIAMHFDGFRWSETRLAKTRASSGKRSTSRRASQSSLSTPLKIIGVAAILSVVGGLTYAVSKLTGSDDSGTQIARSPDSEKTGNGGKSSIGRPTPSKPQIDNPPPAKPPPTKTPSNGASVNSPTNTRTLAPSTAGTPGKAPQGIAPSKNPQPTNPQPTNPEPTNPQPTNPQPTNPRLTNPRLTNPQLTNPQLTNPQLTNPQLTNPQPTNPQPTNPKPDGASRAEAAPAKPLPATLLPPNPSSVRPAPDKRPPAVPQGPGPKPVRAPLQRTAIVAEAPETCPPWRIPKDDQPGGKGPVPYEHVPFRQVTLKSIASRSKANGMALRLLGLADPMVEKIEGRNKDELDVFMKKVPDGNPNAKPLAKFFVEAGNKVEFTWVYESNAKDAKDVQAARAKLCHCVLEVGVGDGGPPVRLALMEKIRPKQLELNDGIAIIGRKVPAPRGGVQDENIAAWDCSPLKLGQGRLRLKDGNENFDFGPKVDSADPTSVPALAKKLGFEEIHVHCLVVSPSGDTLEFTVDCKPSEPDINAEKKSLDEKQTRIQNELNAFDKADPFGKKWNRIIRNLSKEIGKTPPSAPQGPPEGASGGKGANEALRKWNEENNNYRDVIVQDDVIKPAKQEANRLGDESSKLSGQITDVRAKIASISFLSAVLYREVTTGDKRTIRVESIVIGDPPGGD